MEKDIQLISRLLRERPHPELRNEPPLDSLEKPVPNPLMASLWIGSGAGWPLKGLGLASPNYQVGAHFEALFKGVLMAASKSIETFFYHFNFPRTAVHVNHIRNWCQVATIFLYSKYKHFRILVSSYSCILPQVTTFFKRFATFILRYFLAIKSFCQKASLVKTNNSC